MSTTLSAKFDSRREADMAVERLVQQFEIERTDIFVVADAEDNSAGTVQVGADNAAAEPSPEKRDDVQLAGHVVVSVDIEDDDRATEVRSAFSEFQGGDVIEG